MVSYFPIPCPGETVTNFVARIVEIQGCSGSEPSLAALFGKRAVTHVIDLSSHPSATRTGMAPLIGNDANNLTSRHVSSRTAVGLETPEMLLQSQMDLLYKAGSHHPASCIPVPRCVSPQLKSRMCRTGKRARKNLQPRRNRQ
jgi:hypothetical protein